MRILADENIPLAREMLLPYGEVVTMHGRNITPASLKDFDALLVRSITKVDENLLIGSKIGFVGTATAGTDHVDTEWLHRNGIAFANAAGGNANSVAEYMVALILRFCVEKRIPTEGRTIGIIGIGNIGSRLVPMVSTLGMKAFLNDPPLADAGKLNDWKSLEALSHCDFLTIHTPLIKEGKYPTFHLFSAENLTKLNPDIFFINAARGEVVDNTDLLNTLDSGRLRHVSLDVWENEPLINISLLEKVYHSSPHIAGYSYDGKINGTIMMVNALTAHFGLRPSFDPESLRPKVSNPIISFNNHGLSHEESLLGIIHSAYDFSMDHRKMQAMGQEKSPEDRGQYFDRLRKEYPLRREFTNYTVTLTDNDPKLRQKLNGLGFKVAA